MADNGTEIVQATAVEAPAPLISMTPMDLLARAVEREAYKRAVAECRRLGGHPIWIASAYHCAEAIEALGREA